ncbi:MAG: hypothetical protein C4526_09790 [Nitrospiraceae bacterium]|nr:MAG: hypothetical protein C4526_09790 [Nitrospiraceae bacterium]
MTIDELKKHIDQEFENVDRIMNELFFLYKPEKTEYTLAEQAAVAAFIVNIYSGAERILKQMLLFDRLDVQDSPEWHEKVLRKSSEIGILPPELFQVLSNYLSFRNYFIYHYIFNIKWENLKALTDAVNDVISKFRSEVTEYLQTI